MPPAWRFLYALSRPTDTTCMFDFDANLLGDNPDWRSVLEAYATLSRSHKQTDPEHDGWLKRVSSIDGVEDDRLSPIHGRLIAHGLLKFEMSDRRSGIRYQITTAASRLLARTDEDDDPVQEAERHVRCA